MFPIHLTLFTRSPSSKRSSGGIPTSSTPVLPFTVVPVAWLGQNHHNNRHHLSVARRRVTLQCSVGRAVTLCVCPTATKKPPRSTLDRIPLRCGLEKAQPDSNVCRPSPSAERGQLTMPACPKPTVFAGNDVVTRACSIVMSIYRLPSSRSRAPHHIPTHAPVKVDVGLKISPRASTPHCPANIAVSPPRCHVGSCQAKDAVHW